MRPFVYNALPARVIFGHGTIGQVSDEVRRLGRYRAIVLSTPQQRGIAETLAAHLGGVAVGIFSHAAMHTPVDVTDQAVRQIRHLGADCTIAIGGGSTIGLGKAIALRTGLPQIVIPTTYAGSEATPILGETADGVKTTQRNLALLPEVIIYDVDLTLTLPVALAMTSGMNAMAHAVEALYAQDANPVVSLLAEQAIATLARALPRIRDNPDDCDARADALYGAWAAGTCLGSVGMALHHKLCHVLGGSFGLPHAETHTVLLPHVVAFNAPAAPEAMDRIARALQTECAVQGLFDLTAALGVGQNLGDLGLQKSDLDKAAEIAVAVPYANHRPVTRDAVRGLLQDATNGRPPRAPSDRSAIAETTHA